VNRIAWSGDSIGQWEGETLVVDTVGVRPEAELFMTGNLHATEHTHIIERMKKTGPSTFRVWTTVIDPEIFTRPYHYTGTYQTVDVEMPSADDCEFNTRENGSSVNLTPPWEKK